MEKPLMSKESDPELSKTIKKLRNDLERYKGMSSFNYGIFTMSEDRLKKVLTMSIWQRLKFLFTGKAKL